MLYPKGIRVTRATKDALRDYLKGLFKKDFRDATPGNKTLDVIYPTQNATEGPYIRLHRLGNREPWCMGDGEITFDEYEITFLLDVVVPQTDEQSPDKEGPGINIVNFSKNTSRKLGDNGEMSDDICDCLTEIFNYSSEWREGLSRIGIHNARLKDERETYNGGDYQNPMRLVFNAYVQTS